MYGCISKPNRGGSEAECLGDSCDFRRCDGFLVFAAALTSVKHNPKSGPLGEHLKKRVPYFQEENVQDI